MNYTEAIEYIHSVNWIFCNPGLDRVKTLCHALGDPQDKLRFIHVAGTNGKGSFCSMLDSVLREQGYRVGLFTSPYIMEFGERMRVDGKNISDGELCSLVERVKPIADSMDDKPTEFELITALAFLYFAEKKCDYVVLECGLGGRLDATNVIKTPILSVVTGIALDHTAILGDTHEKIAAEKAGIIRAGVPTLWCGSHDGAEQVIKEKCETYIWDKAVSLGFEPLGVEVEIMADGGQPYPCRVIISGEFTQGQKQQLSHWIQQELAVKTEDQEWTWSKR